MHRRLGLMQRRTRLLLDGRNHYTVPLVRLVEPSGNWPMANFKVYITKDHGHANGTGLGASTSAPGKISIYIIYINI